MLSTNYTLLTFNSGDLMPMVQNTKNRSSNFRILAIMAVDKQLMFSCPASDAKTDYAKAGGDQNDFAAAIEAAKNGTFVVIGGSKGDDITTYQKLLAEVGLTEQQMGYITYDSTSDAITAALGGNVDFVISKPAAASQYVESGDLHAVSFEVENQKASHDMFIRINGQTNRLTGINHTYANGNTQFNYLVTMKEDGTVFIRMGKGHYILKNFETWTGMAQPLEKTEQLYSQAVTLIGGTTATYGGDGITGVVSAERDGYLITSIPYDENFVLKVDGKETMLFRANTAFLGAKIPSGEHKIVLVYHAPGRAAGSWCSLMGGMLALILVICEKKKQQNGSERAGESKMLQKQRKYYIIRV